MYQETWLHDNDDVSMYNQPGYNMIHQGKLCCGHCGLIIYLNDEYTHTVSKDLYKDSTVREGILLTLAEKLFPKKLLLATFINPQRTTAAIQILYNLSMNFLLWYIH